MARDGGLPALFLRHLPDLHWQSVESGGTGRGVPDYNYCGAGAEGWVEFKRVTGWRVEVRPEQVAWAERRTRAGGRVFLAARKGRDLLWLFPGEHFRSVMVYGVRSEEPLLHAAGRPSEWPWAAVREALQK